MLCQRVPLIMHPQLPLEILDLIVDYVGTDGGKDRNQDLLALCVSNRAFVARCQFYIFRSVTLYPPSDILGRWVLPRVAKEYRRTLQFAESVSRRPFLALHVRKLEYNLTSTIRESDLGFHALLRALEGMSNVSKLSLGFDDSVAVVPFMAVGSPAWKRAMFGLIRSPKMRYLTLRNIVSIPWDVLFNASFFHTLELRNTDVFIREDGHPHLRLPNRALRSLTCDTVSLLANHEKLLQSSTSLVGPDFSKLQVLDLTFSTDVLRTVGMTQLDVLSQSTQLRELRITTIETLSSEPLPCVLDLLHEDCVQSLAHLTFTSLLYVDTRGVVSGPVITLPYRGLTESTMFPQLTHLETLTIRIVIQGSLNLGPWSFGSQWASIVGLLEHPYTFPVLRKVRMEVTARVLCDEGEDVRVANGFQADSLVSTVWRSVYPAYLEPLEGLRKGGRRVEFEFKAVKEEGRRLR